MNPVIALQLAHARSLELQAEARRYRLAKSLSRRRGDTSAAASRRITEYAPCTA